MTDHKLRVAIATSGRFHVLDLARELHQLGHQVRFYSGLPTSRAMAFGLDKACAKSLFPFSAPLMAWQRYAPKRLPYLQSWLSVRSLDLLVSQRLEPCDVFIFMSGIYLKAAEVARKKYGAQLWIERGSRHILSQAEILAKVEGLSRSVET